MRSAWPKVSKFGAKFRKRSAPAGISRRSNVRGGSLVRPSLFFALVCALLVASATGPRAQLMSAAEVVRAKATFQAISAGKWKQAKSAAAGVRDPLFAKIVRWIDFERHDTRASFDAITQFIKDNPDWPGQKRLLRNAEEAMTRGASHTAMLDWFDRHALRTVPPDWSVWAPSSWPPARRSRRGRSCARLGWRVILPSSEKKVWGCPR